MLKFDEIITNIDPEMDYKLSEMAKILGVSYSSLLAHVYRKSFPARKIFGKYYVNGRDVRDYLIGDKPAYRDDPSAWK